MKFAQRLDLVPPYLFAELERKIDEKRREGVDVISLGIGDPDLPTPEPVIRALQQAAADPQTHQYPSNRGLERFREAIAGFYADRFETDVDPGSEIVPVLGGKEGVAHIAFACLDPGDVALSPEPGYPPYTSGPLFAGAEVVYLPLREENGFMPDLEAIPTEALERANLLFLNYPNNPTGAVVAPGFFERAVAFAREHGVVVVHDNAYSEIAFDGYRPPSFLATDGAKDVGVEIFSLSKGWNMTGWRIGWVAGNAEVVERYRQLKTNLDSGMFDALQVAGAAALNEAGEFPAEMSAIYARRRDLMIDALARIGLPAKPSQATPYIWVHVPEGYTSETFTELVLAEAGVVVSPGPSFGPSGEGYVRISLTVADERLEQAADRIATSLRVGAGA
ncbi:MAG TPA: LL-diaminopimelate aminotransferase [Gaiellaceae bacterium]|jgi:LL-diaminopimelate aminotransferase|nr:LL-diaminopimelate aminotransferase [Gaiellaceae bacterium]